MWWELLVILFIYCFTSYFIDYKNFQLINVSIVTQRANDS